VAERPERRRKGQLSFRCGWSCGRAGRGDGVGANEYLAFKQDVPAEYESAAADRSTTDLIVATSSRTPPARHWIGVQPTVEQLARNTGQRIRLVAETGDGGGRHRHAGRQDRQSGQRRTTVADAAPG